MCIRDRDDEEHDTENEQRDFAPVEYDPANVQRDRECDQTRAERDEKYDGLSATTSNTHGRGFYQSAATCVYWWPATFFGRRTFLNTKSISQRSPAVPESRPEITVNDLGVIRCSDHPATAVDDAPIIISAARSLVDTLPRK